jgi:hypothetical protein
MFENGESLNFSEQWSENVFETHSCYNLIIHSLPGNKFLINNDDKNGPITIGATGIF